ncbi:hypothetical protein MXB_4000 [Myxobolus squamalis]|nr:hypothetical protein MXB_4000 [Myxobolus squamalis]
MVSWNQDEGLNFYINGSLIATDSSGDPILYAPSVEMSPNLLIGRGFNSNEVKANRFILFSLTIFPKKLREKEATATYLNLISNKFSKAVITNLRVINDFGRVIRLIPNKGMIPSDGLLIKQGNKYQILSLIDLPSKNPSIETKNTPVKSNSASQQISLYAEDYEHGIPLYINNRPSPYTFKTDKTYDDYINVIISSKTPDTYPTYHWVFNDIAESSNIIPKTNPPVYYSGKVVPSKDKNGGLLMDGFTGNLQINDFSYQCIFNPGSCDRGTTILLRVRLEESLGGTDNTLRFILDTGGHHGEGFSIYLLGGRIVAEVSLNKQIWKLESGISFGEWLILILVWDPKDGGKLELYSNGKLLEKVSRSAEKQGFSNLRSQTIHIGASSVKSGNEKFEGARFSAKIFSIFDRYLDKPQALNQFLFYWNHNQPVNYPRYINTNFENRAGVDVVINPDKGEHKDDGYNVNNGLMLELRLEEKGPITTYPVIFKARGGLADSKNLLLSGENSLLVMSEEDQSKVIESIITSKLSCFEPQGLFKDPSDKSSYITCQDGIAMRQKCPTESFWDDEIKSCKLLDGIDFKNIGISQPLITIDQNSKNNNTGYTSSTRTFIIYLKNLAPLYVKVSDKFGLIDSFIVPENSSMSKAFNLTYGVPLNLFATSLNDSDSEPLLINGQSIWSVTTGSGVTNTSIIIYHPNQLILKTKQKLEEKKLQQINKYSNKSEGNITLPDAGKEFYHKVELKTTPSPAIVTLPSPPQGNISTIRFAFIACNMVSSRVKFEEKYSQLNSVEMKPNQTVRVFLEGDVQGHYVTFFAHFLDKTNPQKLKINGLDEINIPVSILINMKSPPGAIVIHTNGSS